MVQLGQFQNCLNLNPPDPHEKNIFRKTSIFFSIRIVILPRVVKIVTAVMAVMVVIGGMD